MKVRNGFVSNSSSSSFLVFFTEEIKSEQELYSVIWHSKEKEDKFKKKYTFKELGKIIKKYNDWRDSFKNMNMTFEEYKKQSIKTIFNDIEKQGPNNYLFALYEIFEIGYFEDGKLILEDLKDKKSPYEDDLGLQPIRFKGEYSNIEELEEDIKLNDRIENDIENFDWNIHKEEYYEELRSFVNELNDIKDKLKEINEYVEKHKHMIFYSFQFSDESGTFFSSLEHNGIFDDLPTYFESHH